MVAEEPKPNVGETWKLKYWQRTYWSQCTAVLLSYNGAYWGWEFRPRGCSSSMSRTRIKFIRRVDSKGE